MKDGVKLFIFSAVVFTAAYGASYLFPFPFELLLLLTFYFTSYTFIFNSRLQKAYNDENKNKFTFTFMALTSIKMLSSLVLLAACLYIFKEHRLNIGVCTLSYYMLYTVFEVALWKAKLKG